MRRWALLLAMGLPLAGAMDAGAQQRQGPPHEWIFGAWTGGLFPPGEANTPACFGSPTVIFTRDVVMRVSLLDPTYRQRTIETVAQVPDGLEMRFLPAAPELGALGARQAPDAGFGCGNNPNALKIQRKGPDEIAFPGCSDFPATLKRCTTAAK